MHVTRSADVYFDRIFSHDRRKRESVKKDLIQLGVHLSVHVGGVFSGPKTERFLSTDWVSHLD